MRTLRLLLTATLLLVLAACGSDNSGTLPEPTISNVNPTSLEAGAEITITGANYYALDGLANARVEVCGVAVTADLSEPVTRTILLPPGGKITAQVGTEVTATIPAYGFTPGVSDVRVIRPDGASATVKDAVTCFVPTPEEPEEPAPEEPAVPEPEEPEPEAPTPPVITSFTAPAAFELGQVVTFTWSITSEDDSDLTCSLNPGDETGVITLADCAEPFEHTYAAAGAFTAELTVTDEHEQGDEATHTVTVSEPAPSSRPPLASPSSRDRATYCWAIRPLSLGSSATPTAVTSPARSTPATRQASSHSMTATVPSSTRTPWLTN